MPADLKSQVRDYTHFLVDEVEPLTVEEIKRLVGADDEPRYVVSPPRRGVPGWAMAIFAAAAVLFMVGGLAWLLPASDDPVVDSTPSTTPQVTETTIGGDNQPVTELGEPLVIGPGSWSVAATITATSTEGLNAIAAEVLAWDGVFEVAIAQDEETWRELTGFTYCPVDGTPSCGEGLVVLVAEPWMSQVALHLENELGMSAVIAAQIPVEVWEAYVDSITSMEPPELTFDTASLGEEIPLSRPRALDDNLALVETFSSISMAVELEVDGERMQAAVEAQTYEDEYPGWVEVRGTWSNYVANGRSSDAYLDASDQSVIMANLTSFTELDHPLGPRRVYYLAGLPLDAAVVATQLTDGTPVWQRPVDGMVLIVDEPGSLPERFRPFYDQDGLPDLEDMAPADPFVVLDATGNEILRIEEVGELLGDRELIITDLRISPITVGNTIARSPGLSFTVTDKTQLGEGVPEKFWAADGIVSTGGALWVGTQDFGESAPFGALYRLDPTSGEITERIEMAGGVADLLVDDDVLWVLAGNGELHKLDLPSGEITDTITIPCAVDDCFWNRRSDLLIAGDDLWVTGGSGQWSVDPTTGDVDSWAGEESEDTNMWLGEAGGLIWALRSHDGHIRSLDPSTGEWADYQMHEMAAVDAHESWATLVGDDIWLVPCCAREVVRFDTATHEVAAIHGPGWQLAVTTFDALWRAGDGLNRIDLTTGQLTDSLVIEGLEPRAIIADDSGAIWVSGEDVVIRIDASTRQITDIIEVAGGVQLLAVDGVIWVAGEDGTVTRIAAD